MEDSSIAFDNIDTSDGFMPAITLGGGERAEINFGVTGDLKHYESIEGLGFIALCAPHALQYNIPLWFSSHGGVEMLEDKGKYETVLKNGSIVVTCKDWDYSIQSEQECFRLNAGCSVASSILAPPPPTLLPRPALLSPSPSPLGDNVGELSLDSALSMKQLGRNMPVSFSVVFPSGQVPCLAFVGWTTPTFRYVESQFSMFDKDETLLEEHTHEGCEYGQHTEVDGETPGDVTPSASSKKTFRTAFMVCLCSLLPTYTAQLIGPVRYGEGQGVKVWNWGERKGSEFGIGGREGGRTRIWGGRGSEFGIGGNEACSFLQSLSSPQGMLYSEPINWRGGVQF